MAGKNQVSEGRPTPRQQRIAELAALPYQELLARSVSAIELARRSRHDEVQQQYRDDCWAACDKSGRALTIWTDALAEVHRRERAARASNAELPTTIPGARCP